MYSILQTTVFPVCCAGRGNEKGPNLSTADPQEEAVLKEKLAELKNQFDKERKEPKQATFLQQLGRKACCSGEAPPARQSLPTAPPVRSEEVKVPTAAADLGKDTALDRLEPAKPIPPGGPPELNGKFMISAVEGDMDQYLKDMGTGWTLRTVASSLGFGVGVQTLTASHCPDAHGDSITLLYQGGAEYRQEFTVGNGPQVTASPSEDLQLTPSWEGTALRIHVRSVDGDDKAVRWFYYQGENLISEMCSLQGTRVKIVYEPSQRQI